ncbi:MAG: RHS repeat-associated core domain-containing protein [Bacteroidales bacterium]
MLYVQFGSKAILTFNNEESKEVTEQSVTEIKNFESGRFNYQLLKQIIGIKIDLDLSSMRITDSTYFDDFFAQLGTVVLSQLDTTDIPTQEIQNEVISLVKSWIAYAASVAFFNDEDHDLFGEDIKYNEGFQDLDGYHQYNGNISGIKWQIADPGEASNTNIHGYGFQYDQLDRLTDATYGLGQDQFFQSHPDYYSMNNLTYDLNGNILSMERHGITGFNGNDPVFGIADNLTYNYSSNGNSTGNKLMSVTDAITSNNSITSNDFRNGNSGTGEDYTYDANGNLTSDANKGITAITYNHLNLPGEIVFANQARITYLYDALGVKHKKVVYHEGTNNAQPEYTQIYSGDAVYINNELQYINMPDGRLTPITTGGFQYEYFLKDHLGNIMVTFTNSNVNNYEPLILTKEHYYPFGLTFPDPDLSYQASGTINNLKYNGKELQEDWNLNLYDYGARLYDGVIGRWGVADPLAEQYRRWSPYNYCMNNPMRYIDPDGMAADGFTINDDGYIKKVDNTGGDKFDVLYKKENYDNGKKEYDETGSGDKGLKVNDTKILPNLAKVKNVFEGGDLSKSSTLNKADAVNVFKFAASNSDVEWSLSKYNGVGRSTNFMISTLHNDRFAPSFSRLGLSESSILITMHSHPGANDEIQSMGFVDYDGFVHGDFKESYSRTKNNGGKEPFPSYIFFPSTKHIGKAGPYKNSLLKTSLEQIFN